jgi:hypothetical protein
VFRDTEGIFPEPEGTKSREIGEHAAPLDIMAGIKLDKTGIAA